MSDGPPGGKCCVQERSGTPHPKYIPHETTKTHTLGARSPKQQQSLHQQRIDGLHHWVKLTGGFWLMEESLRMRKKGVGTVCDSSMLECYTFGEIAGCLWSLGLKCLFLPIYTHTLCMDETYANWPFRTLTLKQLWSLCLWWHCLSLCSSLSWTRLCIIVQSHFWLMLCEICLQTCAFSSPQGR